MTLPIIYAEPPGFPFTPGSTVSVDLPFAFDTPDLLTGAELFTPIVGMLLLDFWFEVDTAWDGISPVGDVGLFTSGFPGLYETILQNVNGDAMYFADTSSEAGVLARPYRSSGEVIQGTAVLEEAQNASYRVAAPSKFITTDPLCVVVSQDGGVASATASVLTASPPTLPVTIVVGVNDTFIFTGAGAPGGGFGTPETFTIPSGTYTTLADLETAVSAAVGESAEAFSTIVTVTDDGTELVFTMVTLGAGQNNNSINEGNGGAAAIGIVDPPVIFGGAVGGDPGSTVGSAILHLTIATPYTP